MPTARVFARGESDRAPEKKKQDGLLHEFERTFEESVLQTFGTRTAVLKLQRA